MELPSPRHLSLSGSYPLDLSGLGDPTDSNSSAGLAFRVKWNSQTPPPQYGGDTLSHILCHYKYLSTEQLRGSE